MPTFTYGQNKQADQLVEKIVRDDVLGCETQLVNYVLDQEDPEAPFTREDAENMYPCVADWSIPKCLEHLRENMTHVDFADWEADILKTAVSELESQFPEHGFENIGLLDLIGMFEFLNNNDMELSVELCDAIRDKTGDYVDVAEVYEWWRVTGWLADHLYELGEVVIRSGWSQYWGRQCSGQSICLDSTMYGVIDRMGFEPEPEDESPLGRLETLDAWQLKQIVGAAVRAFYQEDDGTWNPDKEVNGGDFVQDIGIQLDRYGLTLKEVN